ncbi:MAG: B12-binding domain-containing radical SAM protein [Brevinematia bacterium]
MEKFLYKYRKEKILWNIALVYPEKYSTGMSSLGYLWVYHILQSISWVNCERAFYTDEDIKTIETGRRLNEFDAIFFSISFENDIVNIVSILKKSGIEIFKRNRKGLPLICVGGIATTFLFNYLKYFSDFIFSGDAEIILPKFMELIKNKTNKEEINAIFEDVKYEGIYKSEGTNNYLPYYSAKDIEIPHSTIISKEAEFENTALISVSKGCLYQCKFCFVSRVYGEYEPFDFNEIIKTAQKFNGLTDRIGLIAATLSNHPDFEKIVDELNKIGFKVSFSAFRVEGLTESFLNKIIENENKTLVIAPETASLKLKKFIGKNIPDELIFDKLKIACEFGIKRIKLYFIIGFPNEEEEDIEAIIDFIRKTREISNQYSKKHNYIPEIIIDINPFVPKPFTPLFEYEMEDIQSLKKKIIRIKNSIRNYGRIFVYGESPKNSLLQYRISKNKISIEEIIKLSD